MTGKKTQTAFGFETIMRDVDTTRFREWFARKNLLAEPKPAPACPTPATSRPAA